MNKSKLGSRVAWDKSSTSSVVEGVCIRGIQGGYHLEGKGEIDL